MPYGDRTNAEDWLFARIVKHLDYDRLAVRPGGKIYLLTPIRLPPMLAVPDYVCFKLELDLNLGKIYFFGKLQICPTRTTALSILGLSVQVFKIMAMAALPVADTVASEFQAPTACKVSFWPMAEEK